jgi:hypothetical protein
MNIKMPSNYTKYEFADNELRSQKAFEVYSNSDFTFYTDGITFFCADNPKSAPYYIGTIKDVVEFLEGFAEEE